MQTTQYSSNSLLWMNDDVLTRMMTSVIGINLYGDVDNDIDDDIVNNAGNERNI